MDIGHSAAQGAKTGSKVLGIIGALVCCAIAVSSVLTAGMPFLAAAAFVGFYTAVGGLLNAIGGGIFGGVIGGITGLFKSKGTSMPHNAQSQAGGVNHSSVLQKGMEISSPDPTPGYKAQRSNSIV